MSAAQLVLLPGLLCDARMFEAQRARFPAALAWDGYAHADRLEDMAAQVLAGVPGRMSLLGHSMGGRVALEVVRQAPEQVERLALVSTGTHPVLPGEADQRHALLALGRAEGAEALVDRWLPPMIAPARRNDDALAGPLRAMCVDAGVETFAAQVAGLLSRPALEDLLPAIRCPVLVAGGELDAWSPPEQHRAIAAAIPRARLAIVPGAGHMLPAEAPDAFNDLVAGWLAMPAAGIIAQGEDA